MSEVLLYLKMLGSASCYELAVLTGLSDDRVQIAVVEAHMERRVFPVRSACGHVTEWRIRGGETTPGPVPLYRRTSLVWGLFRALEDRYGTYHPANLLEARGFDLHVASLEDIERLTFLVQTKEGVGLSQLLTYLSKESYVQDEERAAA